MFRPDGEKKAYVRLAPDYDALDVANKVSLKSSNTMKLLGFESCLSSTKFLYLLSKVVNPVQMM